MGWRLLSEVLDHAPTDLTDRELRVLSVLAYSALDETREIPPVETSKVIQHRIRISNAKKRSEVLASLTAHGALVRIERGRNGVPARFAVARLADPEAPRKPGGFPDEAPRKPGGLKHPGNRVATDPEAPLNPGMKHPENRVATAEDTVFFRGSKSKKNLTRAREAAHSNGSSATADKDRQSLDLDAAKIHALHVRDCRPSLPRAEVQQIGELIRELIVNGHHDPEVVTTALAQWRTRRARGDRIGRGLLEWLIEQIELNGRRQRGGAGMAAYAEELRRKETQT